MGKLLALLLLRAALQRGAALAAVFAGDALSHCPASLRQLHAGCVLGSGTVDLHRCSLSCFGEDGLNGEGKLFTTVHFPSCPGAREQAVPHGQAPQEGALLSRCLAAAGAAAAGTGVCH